MSDAFTKNPPPGFWHNEQSGLLAPVIHAYLNGETLMDWHITILRSYLRQWIMHDGWKGGAELEALRRGVDKLTSQEAIGEWLAQALEIGIDPL